MKGKRETIRAVLVDLADFAQCLSIENEFTIARIKTRRKLLLARVDEAVSYIHLAVLSQLPEMYRVELARWARELQ